jgi:hypothetical protein
VPPPSAAIRRRTRLCRPSCSTFFGGLLDRQVAVVAQHHRRPLPRAEPLQRGAQIEGGVGVECRRLPLDLAPVQEGEPRPAAPLLGDVDVDQGAVRVGVEAFGAGGAVPVPVEADGGGLGQVVGPVPVAAQQVRHSAEPG